jgi:hypothetical protein
MWNKRVQGQVRDPVIAPGARDSIKICHSAKVDQSGFGSGRKRVSLTALDTG